MMSLTTLKPVAGRRLVCPAGCRTLAGAAIAPGATMPDEGAIVPRQTWALRVVGRGDAEVVEALTVWPREEPAGRPGRTAPPAATPAPPTTSSAGSAA